MLLRLKVRGFKNLEDVDVRFGPLTCFVGPNGVGKSNIFDALHFLKLLTEHDIQDAAGRIRRPSQGSYSPLDLFLDGDPSARIELEADLVVPRVVKDDFEREGEAATTYLKYAVAFRYSQEPSPRIELEREELTHHKKGDAAHLIAFPHTRAFLESTFLGVRRGGPLISTSGEVGRPEIRLHQDGGSRGQPFPPGRSPRTVLGGTNTYEYPTVLAARREMASWQFVHLEPSAMRSPDPFGTAPRVTEHGGGMAATLDWLERQATPDVDVLREIVNELRTLNASIEEVRVDRDLAREQLVVLARTRGLDRWLGPRSLSDGTLRYLALLVMKMNPMTGSMVCMEEPENGMHPSRVPALVQLLRDIAVDPELAADDTNPVRQVVLNTHSPDVARQLAPDEIVLVDEVRGRDRTTASVRHVTGTWRDVDAAGVSARRVADFLGGSPLGPGWRDEPQLVFEFGTARP